MVTLKKEKFSAAMRLVTGTVDGKQKISSVNVGALDHLYDGTTQDLAQKIINIVTVLKECFAYTYLETLFTEVNQVSSDA